MPTDVRCAVCGEICEVRLITIALPCSATGIVLFRNVPADVCPQCGEHRFSLHTAKCLVALANANTPPDEVAQVPIYDLANYA